MRGGNDRRSYAGYHHDDAKYGDNQPNKGCPSSPEPLLGAYTQKDAEDTVHDHPTIAQNEGKKSAEPVDFLHHIFLIGQIIGFCNQELQSYFEIFETSNFWRLPFSTWSSVTMELKVSYETQSQANAHPQSQAPAVPRLQFPGKQGVF